MYPVFTLRFVLGLFVPEFFCKLYDRAVGKTTALPPTDTDPLRSAEDLDLAEFVRVEAEMDRLQARKDAILGRIRMRKTPRSRLVTPSDRELPS